MHGDLPICGGMKSHIPKEWIPVECLKQPIVESWTFYNLGGNLHHTMPDTDYIEEAFKRLDCEFIRYRFEYVYVDRAR